MDDADLDRLALAITQTESTNLVSRLSERLGVPVAALLSKLPAGADESIANATRVALDKALDVAVNSLSKAPSKSADLKHKLLSATSGAVGGAFGLTALAVELPVSTTIMLRSIADIARNHGEDIEAPAGKLTCLEVFALGGGGADSSDPNHGYFAVRAALAKSMAEAAQFIAQRGLSQHGAPVLVRLITQIAAQFGVVVTSKVAAQLIPAIGAVGGGVINWLFTDHFQTIARGHFTIRGLERKYGPDMVQTHYLMLREQRASVAQVLIAPG